LTIDKCIYFDTMETDIIIHNIYKKQASPVVGHGLFFIAKTLFTAADLLLSKIVALILSPDNT